MTKKDSNIIIRIDGGRKETFNEICEEMDVSVSSTLIAFIDDVIKRKKIPMNIYALARKNMPRKENLNIILIKKYIDSAIQQMERNRINKVYLFGSYSRGEQTKDSDIDLYIEVEDGFTLFDQGDFASNFKGLANKDVDILTPGSLTPELKKEIRKDMICLYERQR